MIAVVVVPSIQDTDVRDMRPVNGIEASLLGSDALKLWRKGKNRTARGSRAPWTKDAYWGKADGQSSVPEFAGWRTTIRPR